MKFSSSKSESLSYVAILVVLYVDVEKNFPRRFTKLRHEALVGSAFDSGRRYHMLFALFEWMNIYSLDMRL